MDQFSLHFRLGQALKKDAEEPSQVTLLRRAAWEIASKELGDLNADDRLSSLGIDSVATMEMIGFFEEELNAHFPDEDLARVQTVGDLLTLLERAS